MPNKDLNTLNIPGLIDLLAEQTKVYVKILKDGSSKEAYSECKKLIDDITAEIKYRKQNIDEKSRKSRETN